MKNEQNLGRNGSEISQVNRSKKAGRYGVKELWMWRAGRGSQKLVDLGRYV